MNTIPKWIASHGVVGTEDRESGWSLLSNDDQCKCMAHNINADIRWAFLLGMECAMRIVRNAGETSFNGKTVDETAIEGIRSMIRLVQVEIGAGRMPFPEFTTDEMDEVERISWSEKRRSV